MTRGLIAGLMIGVACGDSAIPVGEADAAVPTDAARRTLELPSLEVTWESCPERTGRGGDGAECATVMVPAFYPLAAQGSPSADTIELFVKRIAGESGSHAQLWLLMGGPGGSSALFEPDLDRYRGRSNVDIYLFDHRGVGRSTRLSCPEQEADGSERGRRIAPSEVEDCTDAIRSSVNLDAFTTTQAAYDLAALIAAMREPDKPVFVYGLSYGTYLLNRYLRLGAEPVDGLVFDSLCAPGTCRAGAAFDLNHDRIGRVILNACADDAGCAARIAEPTRFAGELLDRIEMGHCSNLWDAVAGWEPPTRESITRLLGVLIQSPRTRGFVPAVLYRLSRCDAADRDALVQIATRFSDLTLPQSALDLNAFHTLGNHINFSELWEDPTAAQEVDLATALFTAGGMSSASELAALWPTYAAPERDVIAETTTPALLLMGELDPQTPPSTGAPLAERYQQIEQTVVVIERGAHNLIVNSPLQGTEETCGSQLLEQFLAQPSATLDTSCATMTLPLVFDGQPALSQDLMGTSDRWGD